MSIERNSYYRGLLYTTISDLGPKLEINLTSPMLTEEHTLPLIVQAFTLLGLGTGSRSSGSWMNSIFGPLPMPTGRPINSLIYSFLVEGSDSSDSRIRFAGRAAALIFLVTRQFEHYDKLRIVLEEILLKHLKDQFYINELLVWRINKEVQALPFLKIEDNVSQSLNLSNNIENLPQSGIIPETALKIRFLEQLAELDTLSSALYNLFTTSKNPSLDQLAKLAGMNKILIGWNLRKYIKAKIIEIENDQIKFLVPQPLRHK